MKLETKLSGLHSIESQLSYRAIFEIDLDNERKVYMSVERTNYMNDVRYIVVVDAQKFLDLWRKCPYPIHADKFNGNIETWKKEKKYPFAEKGFSHGIHSPVPLANVACLLRESADISFWQKSLLFIQGKNYQKPDKSVFVSFTNGITRTIWLLSNGAKFFPVECYGDIKGANLLVQSAGVRSTDIATVDELLPVKRLV